MSDSLAEVLLSTLRGWGAGDEQYGVHASWRCFDKDRYPEPCDCMEQVAADLASDARDHIAAEIEARRDRMQRPLNEIPPAYWLGMDSAASIARGETE
jgi:hypothetical protein